MINYFSTWIPATKPKKFMLMKFLPNLLIPKIPIKIIKQTSKTLMKIKMKLARKRNKQMKETQIKT